MAGESLLAIGDTPNAKAQLVVEKVKRLSQ
jgi:hypothetical protein